MKVEVELEDLETIIFSSAVIKSIEGALAARHKDPFTKPHLVCTTALNNLTNVMNAARRATADTATAWDGELTNKEIKLLASIEHDEYPSVECSAAFRQKNAEVDSLASKGCIRIGQKVEGHIWAGDTRPELVPMPSYTMAITERGREKLKKVLSEDKS